MPEYRPLILNAFTMSAVSHLNYGLWRHPDDQSWRYNELEHWTGLARALEEGGFDSLFIADALGQLDTHGSFTDFAQFVVPELRRRGLLAPRPATPRTLRERLFGHAGLPADHPGHRHARARSASQQP